MEVVKNVKGDWWIYWPSICWYMHTNSIWQNVFLCISAWTYMFGVYSLWLYIIFQIWDCADSRQNCLTRIGLYKALALIALAQQGKIVNTKLLDSYSDQGWLNFMILFLIGVIFQLAIAVWVKQLHDETHWPSPMLWFHRFTWCLA